MKWDYAWALHRTKYVNVLISTDTHKRFSVDAILAYTVL